MAFRFRLNIIIAFGVLMSGQGWSQNIYKGRLGMIYTKNLVETAFLLENHSIEGSVLYDGIIYGGMMLNLNCAEDQLYIVLPESKYYVVALKDKVESFVIGDMFFENIGGEYYQVLHDRRYRLLKRVRKEYEERIDDFENVIVRRFNSKVDYYLDGSKVNSEKEFLLMFPDMKRAIKKYHKANRIYYWDDKEVYMMSVISFVENYEKY